MKIVCQKCKETKDSSEFHKNRRHKTGHHQRCKPCRVEDAGKRWREQKEKLSYENAGYRMKSVYGITMEEYEEMARDVDFSCEICGVRYDKSKRLCVDHDHETGEVRGLLCNSCNRGLGFLKDSSEILKKALAYLNP